MQAKDLKLELYMSLANSFLRHYLPNMALNIFSEYLQALSNHTRNLIVSTTCEFLFMSCIYVCMKYKMMFYKFN